MCAGNIFLANWMDLSSGAHLAAITNLYGFSKWSPICDGCLFDNVITSGNISFEAYRNSSILKNMWFMDVNCLDLNLEILVQCIAF